MLTSTTKYRVFNVRLLNFYVIIRAKKVTMVSSGDGDVGAAKLTGEVIDVIGKLPDMIRSLTGVDISTAIKVKSA